MNMNPEVTMNPEITTAWLIRNLANQSLTTFSVEILQPSWLPTRPLRYLYLTSTRCIEGVLLAVLALISGAGLSDAIVMVLGAFVVLAIEFYLFGYKYGSVTVFSSTIEKISQFLFYFLPLLLLLFLFTSVVYPGIERTIVAVLPAIFYASLHGIRDTPVGWGNDISKIHSPTWSAKTMTETFKIAALIGLGISILIAIFLNQAYPETDLRSNLVYMLIGVSLLGHFLLRSEYAPTYSTITGSVLGVFCGIPVGAVLGMIMGVLLHGDTTLRQAVTFSLPVGLPAGIASAGVGALLYGGLDLIRHALLRAILSYTGVLPWRWRLALNTLVANSQLSCTVTGYVPVHHNEQSLLQNDDFISADESVVATRAAITDFNLDMIEEQISAIFVRKKFDDDKLMSKTLLHDLQVVRNFAQQYRNSEKAKHILTLEKVDAELMRDWLRKLIDEQLSLIPADTKKYEDDEWTLYTILQKQYIDKLTEIKVQNFINENGGVIGPRGGAYNRSQKKARKLLSEVIAHQEYRFISQLLQREDDDNE